MTRHARFSIGLFSDRFEARTFKVKAVNLRCKAKDFRLKAKGTKNVSGLSVENETAGWNIDGATRGSYVELLEYCSRLRGQLWRNYVGQTFNC